jgi:hypothetical protein
MSVTISGLFAYPSEPDEIGRTICRSLQTFQADDRLKDLSGWEEIDIPGRFIATEILRKIESGSTFIADITRPNFNVFFEIGYAIGCAKRTILVRNEGILSDSELIRDIGIFDTLGYSKYRDSASLEKLLSTISDLSPLNIQDKPINIKAPVYILLPQIKGDIETYLISRIKKARLFYRSFDPEEHGRLSALEAIENIGSSHGVVIPLLPNYRVDSKVHNFRAAFLAGLAQAASKLLLFLQSGDDPVPIDYRDLVQRFKFPNQIDEYVADFALSVTERLQSVQTPIVADPSTFLMRLNLGAYYAENESQELGEYYVETDEFRRALRGEVQIVLGRKGSGKTALFFQVRDRLRSNPQNVVLDLKPEGFQLIKFKEQILDYLEQGTREHTITAFWEYLLLLEICHKLLQKDKILHRRNHQLFSAYQKLESSYNTDEYVSEGDFAERMLKLTQRIAMDFGVFKDGMEGLLRLNNEEITNLIHKHNINDLRSQLVDYLNYKQSLWILFDNLDKGWPPHGIRAEDVLSLRCLLDAMGKLQRYFRRDKIATAGIVFIRNDVYENLIDVMPDRGKISSAFVDWTDAALLLELLRRRFLYTGVEGDPSFERIWAQICVSHIRGEETSQYLIDRCMMRPRSLIEFLTFCRSHAVNLRHQRIEIEDIDAGEEAYSNKLVGDISYEIRDIYPPAKDILYEFIECAASMDIKSLDTIISKGAEKYSDKEKILDLLLWYGVIGFRKTRGEPIYIYSVGYDIKRLKALLRKHEEEGFVYLINPAFWKGLGIKNESPS